MGLLLELPRKPMINLIINADDFGLTPGVNEGIIQAHRKGILTSATLMANGGAFEDAVARAKGTPSLGVGCHLVLVGGRAISPPAEIPTLVGPDGALPSSLQTLVSRLALGCVYVADVEREIRAQILKVRNAGIEPTHLDTHKHTHVHPKVMAALCRVAREMGLLRVRNPSERLRDLWRTAPPGGPSWKALSRDAAVWTAEPWFQSLARKYGLQSPDNFLGLGMTGRLDSASLSRLILTLREGYTEIMVHPGICDADLARTGSRLQEHRELELEALLSLDARQAVESRGARLISYRDLT